jgi:hypothetical protein
MSSMPWSLAAQPSGRSLTVGISNNRRNILRLRRAHEKASDFYEPLQPSIIKQLMRLLDNDSALALVLLS